jgi:hypothetical protein
MRQAPDGPVAHRCAPTGPRRALSVPAVVGALRAARWAIGGAATCEDFRGARAAPTRLRRAPMVPAVVGAHLWATDDAASSGWASRAQVRSYRTAASTVGAGCCRSAACSAMGDRGCGTVRGLSRRTRRSHKVTASADGAGCCGSAACSAMGDRGCGNLQCLSRRTRRSYWTALKRMVRGAKREGPAWPALRVLREWRRDQSMTITFLIDGEAK